MFRIITKNKIQGYITKKLIEKKILSINTLEEFKRRKESMDKEIKICEK